MTPALWNPGAAAKWSLLLTPAFGAWLQMKNWQAMGDAGRAASSWRWALATVMLAIASTVAGVFLPQTPTVELGFRIGGLAYLIAWYAASSRVQSRAVHDRFGDDYPRRGWTAPLVIGTIGGVAFFGVLFMLALLVRGNS